jgi:hypothetical protein
MTSTEIKESIDENLPTNTIGMIVASVVRGILKVMVDYVDQQTGGAANSENVVLTAVANESSFSHSLGSQKIDCKFFKNDRPVNYKIDWEPLATDSIKIYLPIGMASFTGEVFIIKRV